MSSNDVITKITFAMYTFASWKIKKVQDFTGTFLFSKLTN